MDRDVAFGIGGVWKNEESGKFNAEEFVCFEQMVNLFALSDNSIISSTERLHGSSALKWLHKCWLQILAQMEVLKKD